MERMVHAAAMRLEAFPGVTLEVAADGTLLVANARARALLDVTTLPRPMSDVIDARSLTAWERALTGTGPVESVALHLITIHGVALRTFFMSEPVSGSRTMIELPHRLELATITEELHEQQDAWGILNRRLEAQAAELRRVTSARERFYAAMSHELRTPLTAVLGYTNLLLDGIAGEMPAQQRGFVERTHAAAVHLKSLIDDVLDLARLESGTLELELAQTHVRPFTTELIETLQPLAREHSSPLDVEVDDAPEFLTTDPRALRQILLNLLSNAIRFGESRPVRLHVTRVDDDVVFEVIDRGIGIPPEQLPHIFEEFMQLDPARHPGNGLGLSTSRQLADRLGGRLEAESEPGSGSTFRLTLPMTGPAET